MQHDDLNGVVVNTGMSLFKIHELWKCSFFAKTTSIGPRDRFSPGEKFWFHGHLLFAG